jgi:formyl-CoA transferase
MWAAQTDITPAKYTETLGRMDRLHPRNPLANWYQTADGRWLYFLMNRAGPLWADFCQVLGHPELIQDPRYATDEVRAEWPLDCAKVLDQIIAERTYDEWLTRLADFKGAWGPMRSPREIHDHPAVQQNGFVNTHETNGGFTFSFVAPPMQFDERTTYPSGPAPEAGQNTEELLEELGYSWDEIGALHDADVIGVAEATE